MGALFQPYINIMHLEVQIEKKPATTNKCLKNLIFSSNLQGVITSEVPFICLH